MAISREKKQELVTQYVQDLKEAKNLVVFKQSGLSVATDADIRREVRETEWKYNVIRKRLFLRALKEAGYPEVALDQLPWSAVAVYARGDEYAPLKVINKYQKEFKKSKDLDTNFEFLGGWFNKEWKDADYVNELANIPSREELLSKLVWIFNYPVQSLTSVLDQIAKKKVGWWDTAPVAEETKPEEPKEEVKEEVSEEPKEEESKTEVAEEAKSEEATTQETAEQSSDNEEKSE